MWHYESSCYHCLVHTTKCPQKENGESPHISNLTAHLKTLEQKEADSPWKSRGQEIIKLRAEINKIETHKTIQGSMKQWACSLRKSTRMTNPDPN